MWTYCLRKEECNCRFTPPNRLKLKDFLSSFQITLENKALLQHVGCEMCKTGNVFFNNQLISTRVSHASIGMCWWTHHGLLRFSHPFNLSLFRQKFCCQEQVVCERLPARLPANAPHWHTCLYVLITNVYFSPSLASSRPPMALSLSPCPEWAQHRWHKAAWLACHTSIRLRGAAGESKLS